MGLNAMQCIAPLVLARMLMSLTVPEVQQIYGLVALELPWVVIEMAIHGMLVRSLTCQAEALYELACVEFFAGGPKSSQIAKAFSELGVRSYAFDVCRILPG